MKNKEWITSMQAAFGLAAANGAGHCTPDWNRLLPEHRFTDIETFLAGAVKDLRK